MTFKKHKFSNLHAGWRGAALLAAFIVSIALSSAPVSAAVDVVTSIPELGTIAKEIGGANVSVYSVAQPNRDYHRIEARPSDVARIARADLVVRTGLSLDTWMDALTNAARNRRVNRGGAGYVDASTGIRTIEVPTGTITGASGDVHPEGNPHYYYDPIYAKFAARNIVRGLIRVDAAKAGAYRANLTRFYNEIDRRMKGWTAELAPYRGKSVVTYHRAYNYFIRRFGLRQFGSMEPKPGIPPSASHVNALLQGMKRSGVKAVVIEPIYPRRYPDLLARQLGAKYIIAPYSVSNTGPGAYFAFMDKLVDSFRQALSQ